MVHQVNPIATGDLVSSLRRIVICVLGIYHIWVLVFPEEGFLLSCYLRYTYINAKMTHRGVRNLGKGDRILIVGKHGLVPSFICQHDIYMSQQFIFQTYSATYHNKPIVYETRCVGMDVTNMLQLNWRVKVVIAWHIFHQYWIWADLRNIIYPSWHCIAVSLVETICVFKYHKRWYQEFFYYRRFTIIPVLISRRT